MERLIRAVAHLPSWSESLVWEEMAQLGKGKGLDPERPLAGQGKSPAVWVGPQPGPMDKSVISLK